MTAFRNPLVPGFWPSNGLVATSLLEYDILDKWNSSTRNRICYSVCTAQMSLTLQGHYGSFFNLKDILTERKSKYNNRLNRLDLANVWWIFIQIYNIVKLYFIFACMTVVMTFTRKLVKSFLVVSVNRKCTLVKMSFCFGMRKLAVRWKWAFP